MNSRHKFLYQTIITLYILKFLNALPATYCNIPINRTDCGRSPIPVFSYYKPGSRCEIEIWRGCPSYNRFHDEVTCRHFCIGKMNVESAEPAEPNSDENKIVDTNHDPDPCEGDLNKDDCGGTPTSVYTYDRDRKSCVQAVWKGCTTNNMFRNKAKCSEMCKKYRHISMWAEKIEKLTSKQLKQLNAKLDEYLGKNKADTKMTDKFRPISHFGFADAESKPGSLDSKIISGTNEAAPFADDTETTPAAGDTGPTAFAGDTESTSVAGDTGPTTAADETEPTTSVSEAPPS